MADTRGVLIAQPVEAEEKAGAFTFLADVFAHPFEIQTLNLSRQYSAEEIARWRQQFDATVLQWIAAQNSEEYKKHLIATGKLKLDAQGFPKRSDEDTDEEEEDYVTPTQLDVGLAEYINARKKDKMHYHLTINVDPDEDTKRFIISLLKSDHIHALTFGCKLNEAALDDIISAFRPSLSAMINFGDDYELTDAQAQNVLAFCESIPDEKEHRIYIVFSGRQLATETAISFAQFTTHHIEIRHCKIYDSAMVKQYELKGIMHVDCIHLDDNTAYDDNDLQMLIANIQKRNPQVAKYRFELFISGGNYTNPLWGPFFTALTNTKFVNLANVKINGGRFSPEIATALLTALSTCPTLHTLALCSALGEAFGLLPQLARNSALTSFSLRRCHLTQEQLQQLFEALAEAHSAPLIELDVSYNYSCGDDLRDIIITFLRSKPSLRQLQLGACRLSDTTLMPLADFLKTPACHLTALSLFENRFSDDGLDYLGQAMAVNTTLQKLYANHGEIFHHSGQPPYSNAGVLRFVSHLNPNTTLQEAFFIIMESARPNSEEISAQLDAILERNKARVIEQHKNERTLAQQTFVETTILFYQALRTRNPLFARLSADAVNLLLALLTPKSIQPEMARHCIDLVRDNLANRRWRTRVELGTRSLSIFKPIICAGTSVFDNNYFSKNPRKQDSSVVAKAATTASSSAPVNSFTLPVPEFHNSSQPLKKTFATDSLMGVIDDCPGGKNEFYFVDFSKNPPTLIGCLQTPRLNWAYDSVLHALPNGYFVGFMDGEKISKGNHHETSLCVWKVRAEDYRKPVAQIPLRGVGQNRCISDFPNEPYRFMVTRSGNRELHREVYQFDDKNNTLALVRVCQNLSKASDYVRDTMCVQKHLVTITDTLNQIVVHDIIAGGELTNETVTNLNVWGLRLFPQPGQSSFALCGCTPGLQDYRLYLCHINDSNQIEMRPGPEIKAKHLIVHLKTGGFAYVPASNDKSVMVYNPHSGKSTCMTKTRESVFDLFVTPEGFLAINAGESEAVRGYEVRRHYHAVPLPAIDDQNKLIRDICDVPPELAALVSDYSGLLDSNLYRPVPVRTCFPKKYYAVMQRIADLKVKLVNSNEDRLIIKLLDDLVHCLTHKFELTYEQCVSTVVQKYPQLNILNAVAQLEVYMRDSQFGTFFGLARSQDASSLSALRALLFDIEQIPLAARVFTPRENGGLTISQKP